MTDKHDFKALAKSREAVGLTWANHVAWYWENKDTIHKAVKLAERVQGGGNLASCEKALFEILAKVSTINEDAVMRPYRSKIYEIEKIGRDYRNSRERD